MYAAHITLNINVLHLPPPIKGVQSVRSFLGCYVSFS